MNKFFAAIGRRTRWAAGLVVLIAVACASYGVGRTSDSSDVRDVAGRDTSTTARPTPKPSATSEPPRQTAPPPEVSPEPAPTRTSAPSADLPEELRPTDPPLTSTPDRSGPDPTTDETRESSDYDVEYASQVANDLLEDIGTVDERLDDGIGVGSALDLLAGSYGRLAGLGTPPGIDEASYQARLRTLEEFAATAGDAFLDDPIYATARYEVVRKQTRPLLRILSRSLDRDLQLPNR